MSRRKEAYIHTDKLTQCLRKIDSINKDILRTIRWKQNGDLYEILLLGHVRV